MLLKEHLQRAVLKNKNAHVLGPAAAMKSMTLSRVGAANPLYRRAFTTATAPCLQAQERLKPKTRKPLPHQGSKTDARIKDKSRAASVRRGTDPQTRLQESMGRQPGTRHDQFRRAVLAKFSYVLQEMEQQDFNVLGSTQDELNRQATLFMNAVDDSFLLAEQGITRRDKNPLFWNLREAFVRADARGIQKEVRYAFQSFMVRNRFSKTLEDNQQRILDLRFPQEWFPSTRQMQRTIHVHVGPTNSGKTYNAIKALEESSSGVYAGPLRLLATEVYQRFKAKGIPVGLFTGEEIRRPDDTDQFFMSSTVEMIPLNRKFDVAVIDEIQMLGDPDRGNAWTNALLGVQAKEVHVCGEERAANLVKSICATIGDKCIIHRYNRLSPLETESRALDSRFSNLRKGDAVVAFSRLALHALKRKIEKYTGKRCAIIYGSLPPEVRVQQAALFNDPDNDYDFVVASDAIGMGLNLEIRRVILDSVTKFDGEQDRPLTFPEIKQIGGRAGRYRSATNPNGAPPAESMGLVTTMENMDLNAVRKAFKKTPEDITSAYIQPPPGIIERFASYYPPSTPLSFILMRIRTAAALGNRFKVSIVQDHIQMADLVQDIPLEIHDRITLCYMPTKLSTPECQRTTRALAWMIAKHEVGDLLSIKEIPLEYLELDMDNVADQGPSYLNKMEALHVAINQYVWLSYRYAGMFRNQGLAFHIRALVEERLIKVLDRMDFTDKDMQSQRRRKRARAQMREINLAAMGDLSDQDGRELPISQDGPLNDTISEDKLRDMIETSREASHAKIAAEEKIEVKSS